MTLKTDFGKCLLFALSDKENPTVEKAYIVRLDNCHCCNTGMTSK